MTRVLGTTLTIPGWVKGLIQDMDATEAPLGSYTSASNLVPLAAGRMGIRGGSRYVVTLSDDAGTPAEATHICKIQSFSPVGMLIVTYSNGQNKHYATRLTAAGAFFTGTEATSRTDLTAAPSTSWDNASTPARPMMVELWEKIFLVDATTTYASRNTFLSIDASGVVLEPTFSFDGGAAAELYPYCVEEFNNVLFIAGYGDDSTGDRPEMVRHSYLGKSPDAADGFDTDAWIMIGSKGQRVTAMKKGNNLLLIAKDNELYRVSGYGRAYPGWQYQVEKVIQTLGLGVSNPYALEFAEGYWYGIGAQGPFRTDGFMVEPMRGPRDAAWALTSNPETQFVEYHPDRGLMCFGVRQATGLPSGLYLAAGGSAPATYPNVLWTWDVARNVYGPDWGFGLSFHHVRAIPSTTPQTPQGTPVATAATSLSATGYTGNWTNGDATCQTEFYEKTGSGGTFVLISTEAAAATSLARTGRTGHTSYFYKLVHIKSGVRSSDSNVIEAKTPMAAPTISVGGVGGADFITITNPSDNVTVKVENSLDGISGWSTAASYTNQPIGQLESGPLATGQYYRAYTEDLAWTPTTSATSNVELVP